MIMFGLNSNLRPLYFDYTRRIGRDTDEIKCKHVMETVQMKIFQVCLNKHIDMENKGYTFAVIDSSLRELMPGHGVKYGEFPIESTFNLSEH